ncbi:unnamed protein product [Cuscuta campestris]|uniref:BZIP domain-containing protein n=1 Tax=Cuscuta campestris TaxID=132261 RepID=A0A484NFJ3_9ASTE|nr:unnamed protein product [Cuscuta campestris]
MLSAFPATFDPFFSSPFPDFPWDSAFDDLQPDEPAAFLLPTLEPPPLLLPPIQDPPPLLLPKPEPVSQEPGLSNSEYSDEKPNLIKSDENSISGSDEGNRKRGASSRSGSEMDERKRRRMISNRESARRSRMRKQKHLENLKNQVNRQREMNRVLLDRLRTATVQFQQVEAENKQLVAESSFLRQRLWDVRQVLMLRQLQRPQLSSSSSSSAWPYSYDVEQQTMSSLIT